MAKKYAALFSVRACVALWYSTVRYGAVPCITVRNVMLEIRLYRRSIDPALPVNGQPWVTTDHNISNKNNIPTCALHCM